MRRPVGIHYFTPVGKNSIVVSVFVCLSSRITIGTTHPNITKSSLHVTCGLGWALIWWRCNALGTSGFVNDVMFAHIIGQAIGDAGIFKATHQAAANSI